MICKFLFGTFRDQYIATFEDNYSKFFTIDDLECELEILDTSG